MLGYCRSSERVYLLLTNLTKPSYIGYFYLNTLKLGGENKIEGWAKLKQLFSSPRFKILPRQVVMGVEVVGSNPITVYCMDIFQY